MMFYNCCPSQDYLNCFFPLRTDIKNRGTFVLMECEVLHYLMYRIRKAHDITREHS